MPQPKQTKNVMLQVEVQETTRTRLKVEAARLNVSMGALTQRLLLEGLEKLEKQS